MMQLHKVLIGTGPLNGCQAWKVWRAPKSPLDLTIERIPLATTVYSE